MQVRYTPRTAGDPAAVAANLPAGAELHGDAWHFPIQDHEVEPLLARITASGLGVTGLSISRPGLHDAFVHIVRQVDAGFDADATEDAVEEASA
jgi:ABC-2 type transport system ATP-binding protein